MDCKLVHAVAGQYAPMAVLTGPENDRRLCFRSNVLMVTTDKVGGQRFNQSADVVYQFSVVPTELEGAMEIDDASPRIGEQTSAEMKAILDAYVHKGGMSMGGIEHGRFDQRALSYVCGNVCAGAEFAGFALQPGDQMFASLLSERTSALASTDYVITRSLYRTAREFATLAVMLGACGIARVYVADGVVPPAAEVLVGHQLAEYALEVHLRILSASDTLGTGGAHELAFCCGTTNVLRLHAHSIEGGWVRKFLREATFPLPCGVIPLTTGPVRGMQPQNALGPDLVQRVIIGRYFTMVRALGHGDPGEVVEGCRRMTLLRNNTEFRDSADAWQGLSSFAVDFIDRTVSALANMYGLTHNDRSVAASYKRGVRAGARDRHFGVACTTVVPGFWVTLDPLTLPGDPVTPYPLYANQGGDVVTPLLRGGTARPSKMSYHEVNGAQPTAGSKYAIDLRGTSLYEQGFVALYSQQFRGAEDGLATIRQQRMPNTGRGINRPLMIDESNILMDQLYMSPYTPLPLPFVGLIGDTPSTYVAFSTGRRGYATVSDLMTKSITCVAGPIIPFHMAKFGEMRMHPSISRWVLQFANKLHTYEIMGQSELDEFDLPAFTESRGEWTGGASVAPDFTDLADLEVPEPPPDFGRGTGYDGGVDVASSLPPTGRSAAHGSIKHVTPLATGAKIESAKVKPSEGPRGNVSDTYTAAKKAFSGPDTPGTREAAPQDQRVAVAKAVNAEFGPNSSARDQVTKAGSVSGRSAVSAVATHIKGAVTAVLPGRKVSTPTSAKDPDAFEFDRADAMNERLLATRRETPPSLTSQMVHAERTRDAASDAALGVTPVPHADSSDSDYGANAGGSIADYFASGMSAAADNESD